MKVIVAGGRDFRDWGLLSATLDKEKDLIEEMRKAGKHGKVIFYEKG